MGYPIRTTVLLVPIGFLSGFFVSPLLYFAVSGGLFGTLGAILISFGVIAVLLLGIIGLFDHLVFRRGRAEDSQGPPADPYEGWI
ncbi:MAG: DUF2231 domain-containing protein [Armatimonadota bacterium]